MKLLINLKTGVSIRTELEVEDFENTFTEIMYGDYEWLVTSDTALRIEDISSIVQIKKEQQFINSYHCSNPTKEYLEEAIKTVKMSDFRLI